MDEFIMCGFQCSLYITVNRINLFNELHKRKACTNVHDISNYYSFFISFNMLLEKIDAFDVFKLFCLFPNS